jgi:asparagine synthase (glutamine-hydrolysing)
MTYHPDDILQKVDRAAMSVSLETRVPYLDHNLVEFIMSLPLGMKIRNGSSKWILRQVLYRHVPKELMERPKMGFTIPLGQWLRDPLKDWAQDLIEPDYLKKSGYFRSDEVLQMWDEHLKRRTNWGHQLWNILMFQSWLESNI